MAIGILEVKLEHIRGTWHGKYVAEREESITRNYNFSQMTGPFR